MKPTVIFKGSYGTKCMYINTIIRDRKGKLMYSQKLCGRKLMIEKIERGFMKLYVMFIVYKL